MRIILDESPGPMELQNNTSRKHYLGIIYLILIPKCFMGSDQIVTGYADGELGLKPPH